MPGLGNLALAEVTPARVEEALQRESDELSPEFLNHLRAHVHRMFALATGRRLWASGNPSLAIAFLADPKLSGFLNGHALGVDGGWISDGSRESLRVVGCFMS